MSSTGEIIWMAGPQLEDVTTGPGTRYLASGKKFSDYDGIVIVASLFDFDDKIFQTHEINSWKELSQKQDYMDVWPAIYLSDTTWKQNYGVVQWAGAGIHRIIGVKNELESARQG